MGWKAAQKVFKHWRIVKGDTVMVMAGKDKGQKGTIQRVLRDKNLVVVEGKNLVKKHVKKTADQPGGIVTIEAPLHVSNVSLLDPVTGAPCRTAIRWLEDGSKVRVSRGGTSSASVIPKPAIPERKKAEKDGAKATANADASALTWDPVTGEGGLPSLVHKFGRWHVDVAAFQ